MLVLELPEGRPRGAAPLSVDFALVVAEVSQAALRADDCRDLLGRRRFGGVVVSARDLRLRALLFLGGGGSLWRLSRPPLLTASLRPVRDQGKAYSRHQEPEDQARSRSKFPRHRDPSKTPVNRLLRTGKY